MASRRIAGITIEIGGDSTKLNKALQDVDKQLSNTQKNLKDIDKLLQFKPGNAELLAQKQKELQSAIKGTKERLAELKNVNKDALSTEQYDALQREIIETEQKLASLEKEYQSFGSVSAQQLKAAGTQMQEYGKKIEDTGKTLSTKLTLPILAIGGAAIGVAADFDEQMSKVQAISGASEDDMEALRNRAREMGKQTKFSAKEAGQGFEYMAMAGWKTEDMLDGISGVMNLAAASGEDLGTTSDIVTDALTAFGLKAKDTDHFVDVLAAASTNANTNVGMMGETFKYAAPVAGALGYSVDDTALAIGLMANSGIKASNAGTALRGIMTRMVKPTKESAEAMDELGLQITDAQGNVLPFRNVMDQLRTSFGKSEMPTAQLTQKLTELDGQLEKGEITEEEYEAALNDLTKAAYGVNGAEKARLAAMLAGQRGMSGLLAIVNASETDYNKLAGAIDNSSGSAENMADIMQNNLKGDITILISQLQELAISFTESVMPALRECVKWLQGLVEWFSNLSPATKETIVKIMAVVAAIGPLLIIGGKMLSGMGSIVKVIGTVVGKVSLIKTAITGGGGLVATLGSLASSAAPFLIGGAIIAGVIAAVVLIVKNWGKIKDGAKKLGKALGDVGNGIVKGFKTLWKGVSDTMVKLAQGFKSGIEKVKSLASTGMNAVKTTMSTAWTAVKTGVTTAWSNIKTAVSTGINTVKTTMSTGWNNVKTNVSTAWTNITTAVSGKLSSISKSVSSTFSKLKSTIITSFSSIAGKLPNPFSAMVTAASSALSAIKGLFSRLQLRLPSIKLPHISVDWKTLGGVGGFKLKIPKLRIDWYKKAYEDPMMFTRPTVLQTARGLKGFGDGNGGEVVLGMNKLKQLVGASGDMNTTINIYAQPGMDVNQLADAVQYRLAALQKQREVAYA